MAHKQTYSRIESERIAHQLHARTPAYQRALAEARRALGRVDPDRSYVSWSAGKDSMALAHLAHSIHPGIPIWCVDSGVPFRWLAHEREMMVDYAESQGWALTLYPWDVRASAVHLAGDVVGESHARMWDILRSAARAQSRRTVIMGVRAQESRGRRKMAARYGQSSAHGEWTHVRPLLRWTWQDVWAYIIESGMPWLPIYDHLGPEARNDLIGANGVEHGRMAYLRRYYPQAYRVAREMFFPEGA